MWNEWSTLEKLIWLRRRIGGGASWVWRTITGAAPLTLANAVHHAIQSLKQYGLCTQASTPTPDAPVDIVCNNGAIKVRHHSGLPLGYTLLEYIQSTGSQYIDTNITGSTNAVIDMQGTPRTDDVVVFMLAPLNASSYQNGFGQYRSKMGGNFDVGTRRIYNVSYTSSSLTINGVGSLDRYIANNVNLALFGSTSSNRRISNAKLYSAKIYNNDTLVRDFIPAKNSSNVVGLYDLVSGQFFTNRGTGDFTAGAIVDDPVEIYTDGTDEVLTVSGKNLFDPTKVLFGYYRVGSTGDKRTSSANFMSSDDGYIPCLPDTAYTFVGVNKTNGTYSKYNTIYFFDSAKNYLGATSHKLSRPTTGTTPSNCRYLQVRSNPLDTVSVSIQEAFQQFNWQLELGSTATDYEPYHAPQTVSVPMLWGVGTDYRDEVELISGLLTHKVGIKVFDGTEDWIAYTSSTLVIQNATSAWGAVAGVGGYCTHLTVLKAGDTTFAGSCRFATAFNVYEYKTAFGVADVAGFKEKLASEYANGTPIILIYPRSTETTEQGTPHALHTSAGTNVVDVESNVDPVNLSVEYASNN